MNGKEIRRRSRGSALLAALILCAAIGATVAIGSLAARSSAEEQRLRADALCARHAAASGLALGPLAGNAANVLGAPVTSLEVVLVARRAGWCVLRSRAACGSATRAMERTVGEEACR